MEKKYFVLYKTTRTKVASAKKKKINLTIVYSFYYGVELKIKILCLSLVSTKISQIKFKYIISLIILKYVEKNV